MEKSKRKNGELNTKRYWQIFNTLAIVLLVMVRFPVRVWLSQTLDDMLIFGTLSLGCLLMAIHVYRRSRWRFWALITVILLCATLSAWQVSVLRNKDVSSVVFAGYSDRNMGFAWYSPRFPRSDGNCYRIYERYFGNKEIAVMLETDTASFYCYTNRGLIDFNP